MTSFEAGGAEMKEQLVRAALLKPKAEAEEQLPCPRCNATNTKFCYYNNYNLSQPRHFCKTCRRYWTRGGALRDIPVGGGTRRSAKRSRTNSPSSATSSATSSPTVSSTHHSHPLPISSYVPLPAIPVFPGPMSGGSGGGFSSLLALGGLGLGLGLEELGYGFGLGRGSWNLLPEGGYMGGNMNLNGGGGSGGGVGSVCSGGDEGGCVSSGDGGGGATWQVESGGSDCFPSLPELAISTPGYGLK